MEDYFTKEIIKRLVVYYGMLLPFPVIIKQDGVEEQINPIYLLWEGRETNKNELMLFGNIMFAEPDSGLLENVGTKFCDCLPFHSKEGNVSGVVYILNHGAHHTVKNGYRIYLKNMLLTEKGDNLVPDWAVFTKYIVNAGKVYGLEVTAVEDWNIEDLMKDLSPDDQDETFDFLKVVNRILKNYDCRAEIKQFAEDIGNDTVAILYFNYDNPLVKKLLQQEDETDLKLLVEILYIQALQIGGFPLHHNEFGIMNRNILVLMERGL